MVGHVVKPGEAWRVFRTSQVHTCIYINIVQHYVVMTKTLGWGDLFGKNEFHLKILILLIWTPHVIFHSIHSMGFELLNKFKDYTGACAKRNCSFIRKKNKIEIAVWSYWKHVYTWMRCHFVVKNGQPPGL